MFGSAIARRSSRLVVQALRAPQSIRSHGLGNPALCLVRTEQATAAPRDNKPTTLLSNHPHNYYSTHSSSATQQENRHDIQRSSDDPQASTPSQGPSRMRIQFKCIAPSPSPTSSQTPLKPTSDSKATAATEQATCGHVNTHEFSSQAFHHGIVLVQCPSCLNRHLIADHLQWFTSNKTSDDPAFKNDHRTIIDLMRAKGEAVKRGRVVTSHHLRSDPASHPQQDAHNSGEVLEFYE
ncbi:hypothetical protein PCANC_00048 [Puccinia coronata f. sp. avenae]|uniref:DNL-type domain-containing protein n=1 Tax=Puccinia coronata f. sp. avenae TaxID=200324 RepID=A0A2N5W8D3_9BASI|nr:hypothetical protein PCASD_15679 [Puccinia coronata f. sp. avenae]PLW19406.1 hypothetical protein PCANC_06321 [Puccinia coronata f. sp. avenae]PLW58493.1 hypothetical protein PCANC_00048 [Puccinia coronata f. sp. avenae]